MRPRVISIAVAALFSSVWQATAGLAWESDKISLELESDQNSAHAVFKFKNTGTESVTIQRVSSSCDCTVPTLEKKVYKPGESGQIAVDYKGGGGSSHTKSIIVESSAVPNAKRLILEIKVPPAAEISPRELTWIVGERPVEKQQTITVSKKKPTEVLAAVPENSNFTAELETLEKGHRYLVKVKPLDTSKAASGKIHFKINGADDFPNAFARVMEKK